MMHIGRLAIGTFALALTAPLAAQQSPLPASDARAPALVDVHSERFVEDVPIPSFKVDAAWPALPEQWTLGQVSGLAVDSDDDVWILQRPNSLGGTDTGAVQDPPIALCCGPAPHILQFGQDGALLSAWGGPELAPTIEGTSQWPVNVHGLFVDADENVWIGGNGDDDHVVLNFDAEGNFLRQIGRRGVTGGNADADALGNPADISHVGDSILVADGYINKRIVAYSPAPAGADFEGYWGAYASEPTAPSREGTFDQSQATSTGDGGADPDSESFGDIIHCVVRGPDGEIYVCDRRNNRLQLFEERDGEATFVKNIVIAPETGGTRTASDVAFSPDGKYLYVADMMNGRIWILLRDSHRVLGTVGTNGRYPGQFTWLHSIATDSDGNLYTTEVSTGRRVQKLVFTGLE